MMYWVNHATAVPAAGIVVVKVKVFLENARAILCLVASGGNPPEANVAIIIIITSTYLTT